MQQNTSTQRAPKNRRSKSTRTATTGTTHSNNGNTSEKSPKNKQNHSNSPKAKKNSKQTQQSTRKAKQASPKKVQKSSIATHQLIQKEEPIALAPYKASTSFQQMEIHAGLKKNILNMGFKTPTEIQDKSFEKLRKGANLIGIAATGTGKTGAFLIPILDKLLVQPTFKTLVIVPTRELALQVQDEFNKLTVDLPLQCACFIGGINMEKDIRHLKQKNNVIIGTPGRLLDLFQRKLLALDQIEVLILDEFDKMLDMGFIRDIERIVYGMKKRKQTLLFSATQDKKQASIIAEIVSDPFIVEVNNGAKSSMNVEQDIIRVKEGESKFGLLVNLLKQKELEKVILFAETKHLANKLSKNLNLNGIPSDQIHGNKSQNYRVHALERFKTGNIRVLVATDVAARGIDIQNVSHVINYQVPKDYDTYIHRVGRTGRAGKTGIAYTFVE